MEDTKITIIIKNKGRLIANANVSIETVLYGFVTIKGFQIWISNRLNGRLQEYINISPPSILIYGKYSRQVFFEDEKKWEQLEEAIYNKLKEKGNIDLNVQ